MQPEFCCLLSHLCSEPAATQSVNGTNEVLVAKLDGDGANSFFDRRIVGFNCQIENCDECGGKCPNNLGLALNRSSAGTLPF
jgi:hypothetical protein